MSGCGYQFHYIDDDNGDDTFTNASRHLKRVSIRLLKLNLTHFCVKINAASITSFLAGDRGWTSKLKPRGGENGPANTTTHTPP